MTKDECIIALFANEEVEFLTDTLGWIRSTYIARITGMHSQTGRVTLMFLGIAGYRDISFEEMTTRLRRRKERPQPEGAGDSPFIDPTSPYFGVTTLVEVKEILEKEGMTML